LILINSPNNPTGSRISDEELDKIVTLARSRSIYIVFDECYRDLTFFRDTERPLGAILRNLQGVVVIDAFSKPWALTGWRIGYLAASPDVVRAVSTIQTHIISNPNSLAQHALLQVLKDGGADDFVQKAREDLLRRRDWLMAHLTDIKGVKTPEPKGGLFAYVDVRDLMNQENCPDVETLCAELLQKERTLVVPGTAFGHSGGFRISFGGDEIQLHEGVKRVSQFLRAFRHG
jgi:aspartate aminotransferase